MGENLWTIQEAIVCHIDKVYKLPINPKSRILKSIICLLASMISLITNNCTKKENCHWLFWLSIKFIKNQIFVTFLTFVLPNFTSSAGAEDDSSN